MSEIYTIKHASIAACQYVTCPDGSKLTVTDSKDDPVIGRLPLEVQAALNRQFGIVFSLPYASRDEFVKNSVPFEVEV